MPNFLGHPVCTAALTRDSGHILHREDEVILSEPAPVRPNPSGVPNAKWVSVSTVYYYLRQEGYVCL